MVKILDRDVNLAFPLGHHLHCLIAQIPIRVRRADYGYEIADHDAQWRTIESVLDLVAEGSRTSRSSTSSSSPRRRSRSPGSTTCSRRWTG